MIVKRDMLHQIIEDLPEHQLVELAKFIELLLSGEDKNGIGFELWESEPETGQAESAEDHQVNLDEVIQAIKNTPPNAQAITLPTKSWTDYVAQITQEEEISLDVAAWNKTWDALEAEMEANSLTHEEIERREQGV